MNKFLVVGLGNIGAEYANTRHNIGFRMLDAFAEASNVVFEDKRYGSVAQTSVKNASITLLKPSTYMNLSGQAVKYQMQQLKIETDRLFVLVDDVNLPFGQLRIRKQGSAGGHNGLKNIELLLNSAQYARLRFGIGNNYANGQQINYVLGQWTAEEDARIIELLPVTSEIITSFCLQGIERTMNRFNH